MKKFLIRTFISILVLAKFVVLGLYFRTTRDGVKTLVRVEQRSWYQLMIGNGDTLYFDDSFRDSLRVVSDELGRVEQLRTVMGRRISRESKVQAVFAPRLKVIRKEELRKQLSAYVEAESKRAKLRRHHLEELGYYAKTHSVVDEGYNEVMRYRAQLQQEETVSARTLLKLQYYLSRPVGSDGKQQVGTNIALRKISYRVNGQPYVQTDDAGAGFFVKKHTVPPTGLVTLQPQESVVPKGIEGRTLYQYLHPQPDTVRQEFVDSLGNHYRLRLVSSNPKVWTGTQLAPDDTYYEGLFNADFQRDGLGFAVERHIVKSGEWHKNRFHGERMVYTPSRVYGIDVSRHQHERGRKRYPIHWHRLRITHLGSISKKKVAGAVDYPVSFVFIKATEGKSLFNKYYLSDLRAARANGIPVAPYHFFSHLSSGAAQARYFIKHVRLPLATLPPMLDVEPTNAQIAKMGGRKVLFREMLVWLRQVEQVAKHRPILYVSQQFVNQHLVHAPEALRKYDVWIARYGEFKPYVKLKFWQLSPDGRVRGIHGDVDINVYNGTQNDFHAWRK